MFRTTCVVMLAATPVLHPIEVYLGDDATEAQEWYVEHVSEFDALSVESGIPPHLLAPIVLPEVARYNTLSNFCEFTALDAFYVEEGSSAVDFSVGHFQMKPSFAEAVERAISKHPSANLSYPQLLPNLQLSRTDRRSNRLERLASIPHQMAYLSAFVEVVLERFPVVETMCNSDQTAFVASAYNGGFDKSFEAIEDGMWRACYPHGMRHEGKQLRYSEVAVWFSGCL